MREKLAQFQSMFGEHATTNVSKLAAVVKEKEQLIKSLKLAQQQEAAVSLYLVSMSPFQLTLVTGFERSF